MSKSVELSHVQDVVIVTVALKEHGKDLALQLVANNFSDGSIICFKHSSSSDFRHHDPNKCIIDDRMSCCKVDVIETDEAIGVQVESIPQFGHFPMVHLAHDA